MCFTNVCYIFPRNPTDRHDYSYSSPTIADRTACNNGVKTNKRNSNVSIEKLPEIPLPPLPPPSNKDAEILKRNVSLEPETPDNFYATFN